MLIEIFFPSASIFLLILISAREDERMGNNADEAWGEKRK